MSNSRKNFAKIARILDYIQDEELVNIITASNDWQQAVKPFVEPDQPTVYPADPVEFIDQVLGYKLMPQQIEVCQSIANNRNTVVEAGHSIGKSFCAAALAAWWIAIHLQAVVLTIAPTWTQIQNILWRYMRAMARDKDLPGEILDTPRWNVSPLRYAVGLSPHKSSEEDLTAMQGFHSPYLLVIMDEAAGMPRIMYEAIINLATASENRILAIGNPIAQSGPFWEACNSPAWQHIRLSCLDHPNVTTETEVIPGAVSLEWVQGMVADHCTISEPNMAGAFEFRNQWYYPNAIFQARVLGQAPAESENQLIPSGWVFTAQNMESEPTGERLIGLDPSHGGEADSVMICRQGGVLLWIKHRRPQTRDISGELAGWLMDEMTTNDVARGYVDTIGAGIGVVDTCHRNGFPVYGVNVSRPAISKQRFINLRAELYWRIRDALRQNLLCLPPKDDLLAADLTAPKYTYDYLGRIQIEDKQEIKNRIGRSPDEGDALALTFMVNLSTGDLDSGNAYRLAAAAQETSRWSIPQIGSHTDTHGSRWQVGRSSARPGRRRH